ncbi:MAG: hypothetical protein AAB865_01280, partial [Patescibacteria group bacterium]
IDPATGRKLKFEVKHPGELGDLLRRLFPKKGRRHQNADGEEDELVKKIRRETAKAAISRRVTHELRNAYKLIPGLEPKDLRVVYSHPAFVRFERNARGRETLYIYLMCKVVLHRQQRRSVNARLKLDPVQGAFVTLEEIQRHQTASGLAISPNVYPVLQEIGLATPDVDDAEESTDTPPAPRQEPAQ